jgi:hypothetical protein
MLEIRGVHPVIATEPVYLVDVAIDGAFDDVDWEGITQSDPHQPRENWQAVYDEQELPLLSDGRARAVFFFHHLDLGRPLLTSSGPIAIPPLSSTPADLASISYEEP